MKERLIELITLIASDGIGSDDIRRIADTVALAYSDPQAYRATNPDIDDNERGRPLGEWALLTNLPDNVLLQAKSADALFRQIRDSFGPQAPLTLTPEELAKDDLLSALQRIQVQLSALAPETDGYELVDFGEPPEQELQMVLVCSRDLPRVLELASGLGIYAAPAYASRLTTLGDGEDG